MPIILYLLIVLNLELGYTFASPLETSERYPLYAGIVQEQSDLGHQFLRQKYSGDILNAEKTLRAMQSLEEKQNLPPLSYLLGIASYALNIQDGDFEDEAEKNYLRNKVESFTEKGLSICKLARKKKEDPLYMFLQGGMLGFLATLKINSNPTSALSDGIGALKLLERAMDNDSTLVDGYFGQGIFHCSSANAPLMVRATLKLFGRTANMNTGLASLRKSAYRGQYTTIPSAIYLIQFLSPYIEELKHEKQRIFHSLQNTFPNNPEFVFLQNDEALCFYPDSFFTHKNTVDLKHHLPKLVTTDYAAERYTNLVRYQYSLLQPHSTRFSVDTSFDLRDFSYYPVFIEAIKQKRTLEKKTTLKNDSLKIRLQQIEDLRDSCLTLLKQSPMPSNRRKYYKWHINDALSWKKSIVVDTLKDKADNDSVDK